MNSINTSSAPHLLSRNELGTKGEEYVARYLQNNGYKICATNFKLRCGEIDLIARKAEIIAFVEVKLRTQEYFHLSEVITYQKQKKIITTARTYIARHGLSDAVYRFDIALLKPDTYKNDYEISYITNAFTASEY